MKEKKELVYLPGLNGIRTIAAIGVMLSHINLSLNKFNINEYSLFGFNNGKQKSWVLGEHGVTIFFVLSGFLITYLLLKEFQQTSTVKIKDFYIRRILRIWPLYYFYILLVSIILFSSIHFDGRMFYYLTFFANIPFIYNETYSSMDHLWSISVEEQFYLFWPFLFLFLVKRNFSRNICVLIAFFAIFRIYIWFDEPFSIPAFFAVVNRFDCMMFGGLGAYFVFNKAKFLSIIDNRITQIIAWSIMLTLVLNVFWFLNSIIEIFVVSAVTLTIIIGQINVKNRIINLENSIMSYLGKLSFGIYVYHPLVICMFFKYLKFDPNYKVDECIFLVLINLLVVTTTIIISDISYYKFEIFFLKLKHRFSIVKSTNNKTDIG